MSELYPPESQQMDFLGHLEELRRRILTCLIFYVVICCVLFSYGNTILAWLELPARGFLKDFIFISPTEAFAAYFKVVLSVAFVICFPIMLFELWAFLSPALSPKMRGVILAWLCFAVVCFLSGIIFTFCILLPAALNFLLTFGAGIARPMISLSEYVSFATAFIFVGGAVFEIPIVIGILAEAGVLNSHRLRSGRRYAILVNLIIAAAITPTQDVINMLIFALPMIVLYEVGILLAVFIEKRKARF